MSTEQECIGNIVKISDFILNMFLWIRLIKKAMWMRCLFYEMLTFLYICKTNDLSVTDNKCRPGRISVVSISNWKVNWYLIFFLTVYTTTTNYITKVWRLPQSIHITQLPWYRKQAKFVLDAEFPSPRGIRIYSSSYWFLACCLKGFNLLSVLTVDTSGVCRAEVLCCDASAVLTVLCCDTSAVLTVLCCDTSAVLTVLCCDTSSVLTVLCSDTSVVLTVLWCDTSAVLTVLCY